MVDAVLAFLAAWGALVACWVVIVSIWAAIWVTNRRDRRRWDERLMADRRRWELQRQFWQMEDHIRLESLPDWQRKAIEEADRKRAAMKREARRRLGLPEEESRG